MASIENISFEIFPEDPFNPLRPRPTVVQLHLDFTVRFSPAERRSGQVWRGKVGIRGADPTPARSEALFDMVWLETYFTGLSPVRWGFRFQDTFWASASERGPRRFHLQSSVPARDLDEDPAVTQVFNWPDGPTAITFKKEDEVFARISLAQADASGELVPGGEVIEADSPIVRRFFDRPEE